MDESQKELLRQVRELLEDSRRRICDRIENASDRIENVIAKCSLAMGGTGSSSTTPACVDICNSASFPVSNNGAVEVPTPNCCSMDTSVVFAGEAEDLVALTPARCSMEVPCRDSIEMGSASAPATVPTTSAATVDLNPILEAVAPSGGILDREAASHAVPEDTASSAIVDEVGASTCSEPELAVEPDLAPAFTSAAALSTPATTVDTVSVLEVAPMVFTTMVQLQNLYKDSEFCKPSSNQNITSKVRLQRLMLWPSFMGLHTARDEARPQPWPSFREVQGTKESVDIPAHRQFLKKEEFEGSGIYASDNRTKEVLITWSPTSIHGLNTTGVAIGLQILAVCGNLFTPHDCITSHDMCIPRVLRCIDVELWSEMLGRSDSFYMQSSCTIQMQVAAVMGEHTVARTGVFYSALHYLIGLAVNLELQPSWVLLVHRNFSGLPSCMHIETDARLSSFHWDPGILNRCLKEWVLQGLNAYGSNGFVFLQLSKMSHGLEHMDFSIITPFSCPNGSVVCTSCVFDGCGSPNDVDMKLSGRCSYGGFPMLVVPGNSELKLSLVGFTLITVLHVPSAGKNLASVSCDEYLVVEIIDCNGALLSVISWVAGYPDVSAQSPIHCYIASESVNRLGTRVHIHEVVARLVGRLLLIDSATSSNFLNLAKSIVLPRKQQAELSYSTPGIILKLSSAYAIGLANITAVVVSLESAVVATYLNLNAFGLQLWFDPVLASVVEHVLSLQYATGLRSLIGLKGSVYFSHSDQSCKSDWKQGRGEFSQAEHSENLALIPLSKLELDDVASVLCFFRVQGPARMEKSEDISIIKSLQVASALNFGMPVAMDGEVNQHWKFSWDPAGSMFVLCSALLACAPWIRSVAWFWNGLELSTCYLQAHSQGGKNVTSQAIFSDQVEIGHNSYIDKISVGYDYYLDQVFYHDTVYNNLVYYCKDYHHDLDKMKEVHAPWDPGKAALRHPSKTSAWGQADFQEGRNVMTLACVYVFGLISSWASTDGFGPTDQRGARAATYTTSRGYGKASVWITHELIFSSSSSVFLTSSTSDPFLL